jgi:hypothetical protein
LGFSPFQFRHRKKKKGGVEACGGEEGGHAGCCTVQGRPEAVRGPEPGPPGRQPPCRGGGSCACSRSRSRGSAAAGNVYITDVNDYTEPATTTPPTQREHRAAVFSFPPPWMLPCVEPAVSRRAARDLYLPVCWPSSRRTTAPRRVRDLGSLMLSSSPSPCDESLVDAGHRAVERFAGDVGCITAPPCAAPLTSRRSRRADIVTTRTGKYCTIA